MDTPQAAEHTIQGNDDTVKERKLPPAVQAHTPNEVFVFSDGREYTVNRDGSWIKTKEELKGGKRVKASR